jgi:hypothetical protein
MGIDNNIEKWEKSSAKDFWGEIAPYHQHIVQIYEEDQPFLDLLTDFVSNGINVNDCVIVIATESHLKSLDNRLRANGFNVFDLTLRDQFIPLNVDMTLSRFMINGWPDELLFRHLITRLIDRAHMHKRKVRAFAELVAILWSHGLHEATVRLEDLWNKFCETEGFCLFCAYPKTSFNQVPHDSMMNICGAHQKVIAGWGMSGSEIMYKNIPDDRRSVPPT